MKSPVYKSDNITPEGIDGFLIDSGARHFVCESNLLDDDYVFEMGKKVRFSDVFQPRGVNVNFYRKIKDLPTENK